MSETSIVMGQAGNTSRSFGEAVAAWLFGLTAIVFLQALLVHITTVSSWSGVEVMWRLAMAVTALIPFVAFAGGAAVARHEPLEGASLLGLGIMVGVLAVAFFLLSSFGVPRLVYERDEERGVQVERLYPFGAPDLPSQIARRAYVVANPPVSYSLSTDRPLDRPPNWLDYQIHRDGAWAAFAVLNSFLGLLVARAMAREGPRHRRRKVWAAGLVSGLAFLAVATFGRNIVRSSLTVSGVAMAWLPLVVPLVAIGWLSLGPARPALVHERPVAGEKVEV